MNIINICDLNYDQLKKYITSEGIIHNCEYGLFKKFSITMSKEMKKNKEYKLLELDKYEELKEYYNKILYLVNNIKNEYLSGYIVKPCLGLPLNKIILSKKEKIRILKQLKEILILFEKNGIIYDDIHLGNIYYNSDTKKIELIDIDNISINNYEKDLNSFLIQDYCYHGGIDGVNARIYAFNLITYILLINNVEEYDIRVLYESFEQKIKKTSEPYIYELCKNLLTPRINTNCDNEYLIDIIDEKMLIK